MLKRLKLLCFIFKINYWFKIDWVSRLRIIIEKSRFFSFIFNQILWTICKNVTILDIPLITYGITLQLNFRSKQLPRTQKTGWKYKTAREAANFLQVETCTSLRLYIMLLIENTHNKMTMVAAINGIALPLKRKSWRAWLWTALLNINT